MPAAQVSLSLGYSMRADIPSMPFLAPLFDPIRTCLVRDKGDNVGVHPTGHGTFLLVLFSIYQCQWYWLATSLVPLDSCWTPKPSFYQWERQMKRDNHNYMWYDSYSYFFQVVSVLWFREIFSISQYKWTFRMVLKLLPSPIFWFWPVKSSLHSCHVIRTERSISFGVQTP